MNLAHIVESELSLGYAGIGGLRLQLLNSREGWDSDILPLEIVTRRNAHQVVSVRIFPPC